MLDLVSRRKLFYVITALLVVPGLISLALPGGLRRGIDFTSGTIMTVQFARPISQADLRQAFADANHPEAIVQSSSEQVYIIRTRPFEQTRTDASTEQVIDSERA